MRLRRRSIVWGLVLTGCPAADEGAEMSAGGTSGPAVDTSSSSGVPGVTSVAPPMDTTDGPAVTTGSGPGDTSTMTGPGAIFDLGSIPDAPTNDCQQSIDIVFTMDVSTTMGGFINILADEILVVDAALAALDLPSPPQYGLAVFVDDAALVNGGVPYTDANDLRTDFLMWAAFTASNQQVGGGNSNTTFTENSIDALSLAATDFQWRPAATTTRLVIHTTDDTFWDGPTLGNGVMIQHGYGETVTALQDAEARVYAFADTLGGACDCMDVTMGWSTPYMGMTSIPEATDGGVFDVQQILAGTVSLADAIATAVDESYCDPYTPG
jgi:hypothetical protein